MYTSIIAIVLAVTPLASAHGLVASATGDLGGKGQGFGLNAGGENNERDVTIFNSGDFGETEAGGVINPSNDIASMIAQTGSTIPQVSASKGILTMVYHQINADGAGPISCSVSADATGKTFIPMKVTTNVPGNNGRSNAADEDFPLVALMPIGTQCIGQVGDLKRVCIVKCENPVGPFGGSVPVQQGGAAATKLSSAAELQAKAAVTGKAAGKVQKSGDEGGKKKGKGKDEKKGKEKEEEKEKKKKNEEEEEKKKGEGDQKKKKKEEKEKKEKEEEKKKKKEEKEKKEKEEEKKKKEEKEKKEKEEEKNKKEEEKKGGKAEEEKKPKCVRSVEWTA